MTYPEVSTPVENQSQDSRAAAQRRNRNKFTVYPAPRNPMGTVPRAWNVKQDVEQSVPKDIAEIIEFFECGMRYKDRFRWVLRDTLDELLDGQRTGRWSYQHLTKTEKTYLGTAVEVNLTREFNIDDGGHLDWKVAGLDADCKFSKDVGGWEIPVEMYRCEEHGELQGSDNHPAILVWFDDFTSRWLVGVVRITDENLRWKKVKEGDIPVRAYNRDFKRKLNPESLGEIYWLWGGMQDDLPRNLLLHLADEVREKILTSELSGQQRINTLFSEVQQQVINRRVVLTVAQQDDAPKRVRDARPKLKKRGILILGHQDAHPRIAKKLGFEPPVKGEWISVRIVEVEEADKRNKVAMHGKHWAIANPDDPESPITFDYRYLTAPSDD